MIRRLLASLQGSGAAILLDLALGILLAALLTLLPALLLYLRER